ncbi:epoxide hydrolase 1-like [Periophthalmus magnuspinnatus]|uniref:epoxide hydrolase 1-like n=1 Tax=Periophthalmus magnuspinnatus TaxID=409849 RepID=UPI00145B9D0C|nr:epoxide hydrolase 1-like [Periophthalmus magnuspinnatus]XP_055083485.1 epoxide hydrolase 1-like [Periophthalmus magnuspinnatus]
MQRLLDLKDTFFDLDVDRQRLIGSALAAGGISLLAYYFVYKRTERKRIPLGEGWWGAGVKPVSEDTKVYSFKVETSDKEIQDLYERIDRTRFSDPLESSAFHYGFNTTYLKKVVSYWRHQFDWEKQVDTLNKYPHYKTKIEGLDVHFIHVQPKNKAHQKVLPLMLVHGWPGCFYEFYKMIPLLTENRGDVVFEVIIPSIPGYGYSEAPHKKGFNSLAAARIFLTLMERLGFSQFYLQGGDWGSLITTNMAQMKPECVKGLHLNMFTARNNYKGLISMVIGQYLPFLVGFTKEDVKRLFPFFEKNVWAILRETGYMHIQGTKPDTAGCGVNDSPVGLAAYILEKFSIWTDSNNRELEDGGLERKYTLDDLLTVIMVYWTTGSIVSSMRFYKENLSEDPNKRIDGLTNVFVPAGLAAFPNELMHCPETWAKTKYKNVYSYTFMPRGGHFAAFEEPQLLADDVFSFVKKVEK